MKDMGSKLKGFTRKTGDFLSQHQVTVYFSLFLIIVFLSFSTSREVSHAKEILQVKKENALLGLALDDTEKALEDMFEVVNLQAKTINNYQETLDRAGEALNDQSRLISDLVNYLKKIKHWPPKETRPEIDPDKWTDFREDI